MTESLETPPETQKSDELEEIAAELDDIVRTLRAYEESHANRLVGSHREHRQSARNLLHYLGLRSRDLRPLQARLARLGLSSLGRAEGHVLHSVEAVRRVIGRLREVPPRERAPEIPLDVELAHATLERRTEALFGPKPRGRNARIMVTMPGEAAQDYKLVRRLVAAGMNCMRVNCAHDGEDAWQRMAEHLRRAEKKLDRRCLLAMDLGGPKLRTGALAEGPEVVSWHPRWEEHGKVRAASRIWLTPAETASAPTESVDAALPIPTGLLRKARSGDVIHIEDRRGRRRELHIRTAEKAGCIAECDRTTYIESAAKLKLARGGKVVARGRIGKLQPVISPIRLRPGDRLVLTRDPSPGLPARLGPNGEALSPARIACTLPEVFTMVRPGEPISFNDGKFGGVVEAASAGELVVRITQAKEAGNRLRADKGINLPESFLTLPALTEKDRGHLDFIARHADIVALSFAQRAEDVLELDEALQQRGAAGIGVVLKIETRAGFRHLPRLLLTAMRRPTFGVMIARGDLAVECGAARLAELQEEILWLSEAAHVPVIWATQVLETLAKKGTPSRAEITDAAHGAHAECVMLNKGPYILETVELLDDILQRMEQHQSKKSSLLRPLRVADLRLP